MFHPVIMDILLVPLQQAWPPSEPLEVISTHLAENFSVVLQLSFGTGFLLSLPWHCWHIWRFLKPALFPQERYWTLRLCILSLSLFGMGMFWAYTFVVPKAWQFLLFFTQSNQGVWMTRLHPRISEYTLFIVQILMAFGLAFQLPCVMGLLIRVGVLSRPVCERGRRYVIVAIFVLSAILTPPDIISQVALALPLVAFYELTLFICRWLEKSPQSGSLMP